jgi:hypothetical protein
LQIFLPTYNFFQLNYFPFLHYGHEKEEEKGNEEEKEGWQEKEPPIDWCNVASRQSHSHEWFCFCV